ncbi:hypothetical protein D3C73_962570 [compost metagenome]
MPVADAIAQPGRYHGFLEGAVATVIPDDRQVHFHCRRQFAPLRRKATMDVEVRQGFVIGVQVQHHLRAGGQLHQAFLPVLHIGRRLGHGGRLVEPAIEVMPGGVVKTTENAPLAKLADTQRIGLGHYRHLAIEPALLLGDLQALYQQVQHEHAGDFIGMHPCLQMHDGAAGIAAEAPGTHMHRIAIIVVNFERDILHHFPALPLKPMQTAVANAGY